MKDTTIYIALLPDATQDQIKADLQQLGLSNTEIDLAMNSRLCDLEDTINIKKYTKD